jgi:transcriptional regulator with XRE-family HTH domain
MAGFTPMAKPIYLRTARKQRHLTQTQLMSLSLVAQNTISRLERSVKARPVFETVVALANALHVDPQQLRFGPDPKEPPPKRLLAGRRFTHESL